MIIKVCGITNLKDALLAVDSGANALGFNFYPESPRCIDVSAARQICDQLPGDVLKVGIIVKGSGPEGEQLSFLDVVQVYGFRKESEIPFPEQTVWVAVAPTEVNRFPHHDVIIDTSWGRGRLEDWNSLKNLTRDYILSGGLDAGNVQRAITELRPAGVDVCSGVEARPGEKDPVRMQAFLRRVLEVCAEG